MVHERKHKDVARGRVYRIYDLREPSVALYVGSTVGPVNFRFCNHMMHIRCKKSRIKNEMYMYMYILQEGPDNFHWELLQQLDKTTRTTLRIAEQGHMDRLKPRFNKLRAYRTDEQRKRQLREFALRRKTCACGSVVAYGVYARHKRTKKHQRYVTLQLEHLRI